MAAIPGGVPLYGVVAPGDDLDQYAVIDPIYGIDGLRSVVDIVTRDAISAQRRREGMLVYVQADATYYQLASDLLTWTPFSGSAAAGGGSGELIDLGDRMDLTGGSIVDGGLRV